MTTINIEKTIQRLNIDKAPNIEKLVRKAAPIVEKYGLAGKPARTALVIDASGSMRPFYEGGQVQELVDRAAALAALFDDDGQLDMFPFHSNGYMYGSVAPVEASKVVQEMIRKTGYGGTDYAEAFEKLHDFYWPKAGSKLEPVVEKLPPVYAIFVTDGATDNKRRAIDMIRRLSFRPCFVQAISLGYDYDSEDKAPAAAQPEKKGFFGSLFGGGASAPAASASSGSLPGALEFLAKLDDDVPGRYVDNVDFFGTKTPTSLGDEEFFSRMMGEYPQWLVMPEVYGMLGQNSAKSAWG